MSGRRLAKRITVLFLGAGLLGFGSCLNLNLDSLLRFGAYYGAAEFLLDNDSGLFDLFQDTLGGGS